MDIAMIMAAAQGIDLAIKMVLYYAEKHPWILQAFADGREGEYDWDSLEPRSIEELDREVDERRKQRSVEDQA